jgi:glycosyltransferase involved in cell wall biosynthesis
MAIIITAVVCTHNRARALTGTLHSLCCQTLEPELFEILVVDNASTDHTPEVVEKFRNQGTGISIQWIEEPRLGLGYARNAGWHNAAGNIVAYIDDDAEADAGWLEALLTIMLSNHDIWVAGGKVLPIWDGERPSWLKDDLLNAISLLDRSEQMGIIEWPERLIGTNIAFRRKVFEEVGGFDPRLGRQGNRLASEEETDMQQRVHRVGGKVFYIPSAVVYHHVFPERLTKRYFYSRSFGTGQSRAVLACRQLKGLGRAGLLLRTAAGLVFYLFRAMISVGVESRFRNVRVVYGKWGYFCQIVKPAV